MFFIYRSAFKTSVCQITYYIIFVKNFQFNRFQRCKCFTWRQSLYKLQINLTWTHMKILYWRVIPLIQDVPMDAIYICYLQEAWERIRFICSSLENKTNITDLQTPLRDLTYFWPLSPLLKTPEHQKTPFKNGKIGQKWFKLVLLI